MPRNKSLDALVPVNFRCPASLRESFAFACQRNATPATYVLRQLMREYVKANPADDLEQPNG